jgi:hypothetical protein
MDADFSIELGGDDPVLDFPWTDPEGKLAYVDVKRHPEMLARIEEAQRFPELFEFLRSVNSTVSAVESAKCDAWATDELSPEEEIYGASYKFASYVDLIFSSNPNRQSLALHERFAKRLVELLRRTPETPSSVEACVRRAYYANDATVLEGLYFTLYVSGYGDDPARARQNWQIALRLVANALVQISAEEGSREKDRW